MSSKEPHHSTLGNHHPSIQSPAQPPQPGAAARVLAIIRMLSGAAPALFIIGIIAQLILPAHLKPAHLIGDFGGSTEKAEIEAKQAAAVEYARQQAAAAASAQAHAQMEAEAFRKQQEIIAESLAAQSTTANAADWACILGGFIPRDDASPGWEMAGRIMLSACGVSERIRGDMVRSQVEAARQGSAILQRPTPPASSNPVLSAQPARQAKTQSGPNHLPLVP